MKQASLAKRVSFKIGLGGHKGRGIYAHPQRRNYERFELLNQPQALSLELTSSSPWQLDHLWSSLLKEPIRFNKLQLFICIHNQSR